MYIIYSSHIISKINVAIITLNKISNYKAWLSDCFMYSHLQYTLSVWRWRVHWGKLLIRRIINGKLLMKLCSINYLLTAIALMNSFVICEQYVFSRSMKYWRFLSRFTTVIKYVIWLFVQLVTIFYQNIVIIDFVDFEHNYIIYFWKRYLNANIIWLLNKGY